MSLTVEKMPGQNGERHASRHPGSEGAAPLGLTLAPATSVAAGEGSKVVVVTDVNPDGPAAEHGVRSAEDALALRVREAVAQRTRLCA